MNRSSKIIKLFHHLDKSMNYNQFRTLCNEHLVHPKGAKTLHVEEDDNQKIFACIHLEPTFPYEHTKPLPNKIEEIKESNSVLKNEIKKEDIYSKDLSDLEVQRLTYTSHHFWKKRYLFKRTYKKKVLKQRDGI